MQLINKYRNGNADVSIFDNGTRIIESEGDLKLKYPLNIDIRVSEKCAFGMNVATGKAVCDFCHESATTTGADADFDKLFRKLEGLPPGIELAVGVNEFNLKTLHFFMKCKDKGWIVNATINQGHLGRDLLEINWAIEQGWIKGLGISYRPGMKRIPEELLAYPNTVVHVIAGIDSIQEVQLLALNGVKKILVLGEKDFGFNLGKVKITTPKHRDWYKQIHSLFNLFDVVSFDNLGLEQLNVKRFVKNWEEMYQHEYSFYINAVDQTFSPSSRSGNKTPFSETTIEEYFQRINK